MSKSIFIELYNSSEDNGVRDQFVQVVASDKMKEEYKDDYVKESSWGENGELGNINDVEEGTEELRENDDWWYIILHEIKVDCSLTYGS